MYSRVIHNAEFLSSNLSDSVQLPVSFAGHYNFYQQRLVENAEHALFSLVDLIQKHQHQSGWILLIAPEQLPDKFLAACYQLKLEKVLVIHPHQQPDTVSVIATALQGKNYAAIINFAALSVPELESCKTQAQQQQSWLYHVTTDKLLQWHH